VFLQEREIVHCKKGSPSLMSTKWPSEIRVFLSVWVVSLGFLPTQSGRELLSEPLFTILISASFLTLCNTSLNLKWIHWFCFHFNFQFWILACVACLFTIHFHFMFLSFNFLNLFKFLYHIPVINLASCS